jgi:hypothetical protein
MDLSFFSDAIASGDAVVIGVAAVAVLVLLGLKLAGKSIPLVDSIVPTLMRTLAAMRKKPEPEPEAPPIVVADVHTLPGTFGKVSPEALARFEADMVAAGYTKQPDGEWRRARPTPPTGEQ